MPLLFDFAGGESGRCFFKSTTASSRGSLTSAERGYVRNETLKAGCSYLDIAHVTEDFALLHHEGKELERKLVFWDAVHFRPWVYEELNNVLLNVLCNHIPTDAKSKSSRVGV
jgi:hypothetical protein